MATATLRSSPWSPWEQRTSPTTSSNARVSRCINMTDKLNYRSTSLWIFLNNWVSICSGCFFFVGAALPGEVRPHHRSVFDFDEDALLISASIFVEIVRDVLA